MNNVIILFDEHGTPTFHKEREREIFIGVGIAYNINQEKSIFEECDKLCGLSNSKPLKNDRISNSRALEIADQLSSIEMLINVASVNLNNEELFNTINLYEEFGNIFREKFRNVRERKKSQIIHNYVLDHIIFSIISEYVKLYQQSTLFSIFVDNWSLPENDIEIALEWASESIQQKNNEVIKEFFPNIFVKCSKMELLKEDSKRKRFIDVVASVISRDYLSETDTKYSGNIIQTISNIYGKRILFTEYTQTAIDTMRAVMDDISRNG